MDQRLELRTFGGLSIRLGGETVSGFDGLKPQALLVFLAFDPRPHPRESLAEMFWEGPNRSTKLNRLRAAICILRRVVEPFIQAPPGGPVGMDPNADWWLDAAAFDSLLDTAGESVTDDLTAALDLYRGDFLQGFYIKKSASFEDWVATENSRLWIRAFEAYERLIAHHIAHAEYAQGLARATELLRLDPDCESTLARIDELRALSGKREPIQMTKEAEPRAPPPAVPVPIKDTRAPPPHNLPPQPTSFIGREAQIATVTGLLRTPDCRLLTVVGPPGIGKTRLALRVAETLLRDFRDGVWFVPLAAIRNPALVVNTIATALGLTNISGQTEENALKRFLRGRDLLLLLDNFEQVVESAPKVSDLLSAAPHITVMVTSRETLGLYGEQEYLLDTLAESDAIELFAQRARAVRSDFALTEANAPVVAGICARLDHLPLPIELAAARVRMFSPERLLDRLGDSLRLLTGGPRDAPARQQTLRDTVAWSYDLLSEDERRLFARCGVFAGEWTLEAAETVCGPGLSIGVFDGLESLLTKSMIQVSDTDGGEPYFWMLEMLREYAVEQLAASGEETIVRRRHADFYLEFVERIRTDGPPEQTMRAIGRAATELDNIRTAITWWLDTVGAERVLSQMDALGAVSLSSGHFAQGREWAERALEAGRETPPAARLLATRIFVLSAMRQGDRRGAQHAAQTMMDLACAADDKSGIAEAYFWLGTSSALDPEKTEYAQILLERALGMFQELDDQVWSASAFHGLGETERYRGNYERASELYEQCWGLMREIGFTDRLYVALGLGFVALHQGDPERAWHWFAENLQEPISSFPHWHQACLQGLASVFSVMGQPERAARVFGTVDAALEAMGAKLELPDQKEYDHYRALTREQLDDATFEACYAEGRTMSLEDAVADALESGPDEDEPPG